MKGKKETKLLVFEFLLGSKTRVAHTKRDEAGTM